MELHAWINPFRAKSKTTNELASNHIAIKNPAGVFAYDGQLILNPAKQENRDHICRVVEDIVSRYDVDGLHIDDYFYPYPVKGMSIPDNADFAANNNGINDKDDWRRDNVNVFMKQLYETIHKTKPWVKFGVSPFGIYRNEKSAPGLGSRTNGLQNYDDLYADVNKQLRESVIKFDDILQKTNIDKNLITSMSTLQDSLKNLDSLLAKVEGDIDSQSMTLQQYTDALNSCTVSIESTEDVLNYMVSMVSNLRSSVNELRTSESFTKLLDLLQDDVGGLVEYLASPANLEVVRVYALDNFGSGMTPFYTTLALYASALLSVSLMHTHIKRRSDIPTLNTTEAFFGRYFVFFAIGQFTALITVLGNLFYIGIQCYAPFQFWLAAAVASLLFTLINYGFVFAFGNIGEALAIIVLVIQVAGSGGTYPLEMLPKFFQDIYKFMPFNYAMTAMRETIAGSYSNVYLKCILVLLLMAAILIPLSLVCGIIFRPMLKHFNESKSKTKLMHGN